MHFSVDPQNFYFFLKVETYQSFLNYSIEIALIPDVVYLFIGYLAFAEKLNHTFYKPVSSLVRGINESAVQFKIVPSLARYSTRKRIPRLSICLGCRSQTVRYIYSKTETTPEMERLSIAS